MEPPHILPSDAEVGSIEVGDDVQLLTHDVASETDGPRAIIMVDVAVNLILIETLREQMSDDGIDFGPRRIVGESARVGHHSAVDAGGAIATHAVVGAQLPNEVEYYFAGARHFGVRNGECAIGVGVEMVVDKYSRGLRKFEGRLHIVEPG